VDFPFEFTEIARDVIKEVPDLEGNSGMDRIHFVDDGFGREADPEY
jgi:hypothetical protein